jgi:hypothetical protein
MSSAGKIVPVAWIEGGWIYSSQPEQSGKFWIHNNWIWGPDGVENMDTGHWVHNGWIWGPIGAADTATGFYIAENWIYGPGFKLPFA